MGLVLGGVDFGAAFCSSGALNFFGCGWPHHRWLGMVGAAPDYRGSTFVAKTTTLEARAGNLPLKGTTPTELRPACIRVNFRRAAVLNAVGLSGPGSDSLLADGRWQAMTRPFVISFMSTEPAPAGRLAEAARFARRLRAGRARFVSPFALQINFSCPNVGLEPLVLVSEIGATLATIDDEIPGVPLIPKLNLLVPPPVAAVIGRGPLCAAICCSNSIPWGSLPGRIDWRGLFGDASPLASLGGGGLSGAPLTPLVREWAAEYLSRPHAAPLVAGGGVMTPADATVLLELGAAAVEVGSVSIVRPWRTHKIIDAINRWKRGGA